MKLLLFFLLLFAPSQMSAQFFLRCASNSPREGDCIIKQQVKCRSPGPKGENVIWDFSEQDLVNENYKLKYITPKTLSDSIVGIEHRTMYYYQSITDSLLLLGYENPTTWIRYREPETLLIFPFSYGHSFTDYFDGMGNYCNRLGIHIQGKSIVTADATGGMILPDGDTLRNVLRIYTIKKVVEKTKFVSEKSKNDTIPFVLCHDSIDFHLANDSDCLEISTWRWYADGYRYPVFETIKSMAYRSGKCYEHFTTSFYYPPYGQSYDLNDDLENQLRRERVDEEGINRLWGTVERGKGRRYEDEHVIYSFYMDETGNLQLNYFLEEDAKVEVMLYDFQGRQLLRSNIGLLQKGSYQDRLSFNIYPSGEYLLQILVNGKMYGEKILKP